jgi:hypothetical protein
MILEYDPENLADFTSIALDMAVEFDAISDEYENTPPGGVSLRPDIRRDLPAFLGAIANLRAEITRLEALYVAVLAE